MDGPVPDCYSSRVCQFKVLAFDGIVVKSKERDSCIRIDNKLILVQNIVKEQYTSWGMNINRWNTSLHIQLTQKS